MSPARTAQSCLWEATFSVCVVVHLLLRVDYSWNSQWTSRSWCTLYSSLNCNGALWLLVLFDYRYNKICTLLGVRWLKVLKADLTWPKYFPLINVTWQQTAVLVANISLHRSPLRLYLMYVNCHTDLRSNSTFNYLCRLVKEFLSGTTQPKTSYRSRNNSRLFS